MNPKSCRACFESAQSIDAVREVLSPTFSTCDHCTHKSVMHSLKNQYQWRLPRWWVVDGAVVIPMWMVELLKIRGIS